MAELVLNSATRKILDAYLRRPSHAVLLSGEVGIGLGTIAEDLGTQLAGKRQLVTVLSPEKGLISIERVRKLYEQTRSVQQTSRCIVIDDADAMSPDAQNALLKLLEEPVEKIHFILTTHFPESLLATIRSRTQQINILPIGEKESRSVLQRYSLSDTQILQALFLAAGRPAELTRLADDTEYLTSQGRAISDARSFLQAKTYDRLKIIKNYTDRTAALQFLGMCAKLLTFSLLKQKHYAAADSMDLVDTVIKRINANGHVRTHLMYLVTKLP
jgi:DNA polymerase-3 subunit delta'